MNTFNPSLALELERSRNKRPVTASLVASTAAVAPSPVVSQNKVVIEKDRIYRLKKIQALTERVVTPKKEKIAFSASAKLGYIILIILNVVGDILDFALLFGLVTEGISLIYDTVLLPVNLVFLGLNPKNNKAKGQKMLGKFLTRFLGIENIPIVSMFYLRTFYVVDIYKQRKRAAEEGVSNEGV